MVTFGTLTEYFYTSNTQEQSTAGRGPGRGRPVHRHPGMSSGVPVDQTKIAPPEQKPVNITRLLRRLAAEKK